MKKLFFLALLGILLLGTQGAFANTYPGCYQGYGPTSSNYNGTNGDSATFKGWCVDGYGVMTPKATDKNTTNPNIQGGMAVPVLNYNVGPTNANGTPAPVGTFDALIPQQTGVTIVDYGGYTVSPTIDTLSGSGGHYVLPPAYPGETFTINSASKSVITVDTMTPGFALASGVATAQGLTFTASDTIEFSTNGTGMSAGQSLKSPGNAGASITLVSPYQGIWVVTNMQGQVGAIATSDSLWTVISTQ